MPAIHADITEILRSSVVMETAVDMLLCAVPISMAVIIGMIIGWSWRPRWTGILFFGLRNKLRFFIPPGFGTRRIWLFVVTVLSALSVCRRFWTNFGNKRKADDLRCVNTESDPAVVVDNDGEVLSEIAEEIVTAKDLDHLLDLLDETVNCRVWHNLMEKTTPNMSYQAWQHEPQGGGPIMFSSRTVFEDATPELVRDFFWDDEFRVKWDPMLVHFKILEEFPRTGETIVHWIKKFPFFCSDREYIIGRRIWESGKSYYCVTKGVSHPSLRKREKPRRVEQYFSSWCIKAVESPKQNGQWSACEVTLVHYEDMGIPKDIVKVGVRHSMWGSVKKLQSGMRAYQHARTSNTSLSKSVLLVQTATKFSTHISSLAFHSNSSNRKNHNREIEIVKDDPRIHWRWVAMGGIAALLLTMAKKLQKK